MLELPALMYKDKGDQQRDGGSFSYKLISTPEEWADASARGWHETLPDAIAYSESRLAPAPAITIAEDKPVTVEDESPADDNAPVTREELETKAKELKIPFHPNISDKKLAEKISKLLT